MGRFTEHSNPDAVLAIRGLKIACLTQPIIDQLSFNLPEHSITAVVGPSGVGKTTLLKAINHLLQEMKDFHIDGDITLKGIRPTSRYEWRRRVGMVFQKPTIFPTTIFKNVIFGIRHVNPQRNYQTLVETCLRQAFLWQEAKDRLHHPALDLSVGQQQRLAIARTLAVDPDVIMFDEPTASLDEKATAEIERLLRSLRRHKTLLLVTHNMQQARRISDQIIHLEPSANGARAVIKTNHHEEPNHGTH